MPTRMNKTNAEENNHRWWPRRWGEASAKNRQGQQCGWGDNEGSGYDGQQLLKLTTMMTMDTQNAKVVIVGCGCGLDINASCICYSYEPQWWSIVKAIHSPFCSITRFAHLVASFFDCLRVQPIKQDQSDIEPSLRLIWIWCFSGVN